MVISRRPATAAWFAQREPRRCRTSTRGSCVPQTPHGPSGRCPRHLRTAQPGQRPARGLVVGRVHLSQATGGRGSFCSARVRRGRRITATDETLSRETAKFSLLAKDAHARDGLAIAPVLEAPHASSDSTRVQNRREVLRDAIPPRLQFRDALAFEPYAQHTIESVPPSADHAIRHHLRRLAGSMTTANRTTRRTLWCGQGSG